MATSEVEICNSALIKVGSEPISSLTENNKRARLCNQRYADCRDDVLYSHPWNFAIDRVQLTQLAETPAYGFTYKYQIPSNVLRVLGTDGTDELGPSVKWHKESDTILTDESVVYIRFIKKVTDVSLFTPKFEEVVALRLARDIAYSLTQSNSLVTRLNTEYLAWEAQARTFNGQESGIRQVRTTTWRDSRF